MTTKKEQFKLLSNKGKINHTFFGELTLTEEVDVIWESEIKGIETCLWYSSSSQNISDMLDSYAQFLQNLKEHIKVATTALVESLKEDSEYIDFHREELDENLPTDIVDFVMAMTLNNIHLWIDDENSQITMDFMIAPEESDQILCVKFNPQGEVLEVVWES
ncbi:DUF2004 domain-containing protein [Fusobacterium sp.]|uniref:DUF2004 domain-containing protein n=1 Tax=Fusobacterium sp. TaxID=68766 RepID=UPI0025C37596|nr:DUF2004 domain-containing protein [Fusobacterium sp.]MCI7222918.1 DUF2004 domain-containing protein [Fusobacterium sp.]